MQQPPVTFFRNVEKALNNSRLQAALSNLPDGLVAQRNAAIARLRDFETLREKARAIREHTLDHLDYYLEKFADKAEAAGSQVHWAKDGLEACLIIEKICSVTEARLIVKGKSMVSEEINLNEYLKKKGIEVYETDLGEYVVQQRGERPSHMIAPAIHLTPEQIEADFRTNHTDLPIDRTLSTPESLVHEARTLLRRKFLSAQIGITGANFLIAETGSTFIVTNEGNGDLCLLLPPVHIVITSIEKVVPTLKDLTTLLPLLTRSATGQDITAYTTLSTGIRAKEDVDGPTQVHIVLLDNGRSKMLSSKLREALHCIRCGACMNVCPVYNAIGGHAYETVYPGPIGSILTPALSGNWHLWHLPHASTLCGRCNDVCPVKIPLTSLLRYWRGETFKKVQTPSESKIVYTLWAYCSLHPHIYHFIARSISKYHRIFLKMLRYLPIASGWKKHRVLPVLSGQTFQQLWSKKSLEKTSE